MTWGGVLREQKWIDLDAKYRYGYQGDNSEKDEETGWNHFEMREYDPVIGRMLVIDPMRQYWSPYVAMGNNPVNLTDPTGGSTDPKDGDLNEAGTHTWGLDGTKGENGEWGWIAIPTIPDNVVLNFLDNIPGRNYNEEYAVTQEWLAAKNTPYVWGADGPDAADCAGAVCYGIFKVAGKQYGAIYDAGALMKNVTKVSENHGRGTLLFYDYGSDGTIDHVTTTINDTEMIHPSTGKMKILRVPKDYMSKKYLDDKKTKLYYREIDWSKITK